MLSPGPFVGRSGYLLLLDWPVAERLAFGLGASYTFDFVPSALAPLYDGDPHGTMVFARIKVM
jgi:hypothetical protein